MTHKVWYVIKQRNQISPQKSMNFLLINFEIIIGKFLFWYVDLSLIVTLTFSGSSRGILANNTLHHIITQPHQRVFTFIISLFHLSQTLCHDTSIFYFTFDFRCKMISARFITSRVRHTAPSTIKLKAPWTVYHLIKQNDKIINTINYQ